MKPITKKQKRNEKILVEYEKMVEEGWPKLDAYETVGKKHGLTPGGARYAIQCAIALRAKKKP